MINSPDHRIYPKLSKTEIESKPVCYHCGLPCIDDLVRQDDKSFCCNGCLTVYNILSKANLVAYYEKNQAPGVRPAALSDNRFEYLDNPEIVEKLLDYADENRAKVTLLVPQIHCASCIWLLEHLFLLDSGISRSTASLPQRKLTIYYDKKTTTLRKIIELLASLGYEPPLTLDSGNKSQARNPNWGLYAKIGIAGFAFANIMLFSFPEYLSRSGVGDMRLSTTFRYASLILSLPVLFYSASDYFKFAWIGLRKRFMNINIPLALGIGMLFIRSLYDIITGYSSGYLDSFAGLVFFLLLGRLFQQKSYERLSFDRDYRSYFPISCVKKTANGEITVPLTRLRPGDRLVVRNHELVPADSILINGKASIDYSFVTGESQPQELQSGQKVYAGGRQIGGAIELEVISEVSESYLISLWSDQRISSRAKQNSIKLVNIFSKYFTAAVLAIAALAAVFWFWHDQSKAALVVTSVLVVACPCAVALAGPFVLGTATRIWGDNRFFVRNADVIEELFRIDKIVFDKTGTLTKPGNQSISWQGDFSQKDIALVLSLARQSTHPASRTIAQYAGQVTLSDVTDYKEIPGKGISGKVDGHLVEIGSSSWLDKSANKNEKSESGNSYVAIDSNLRGYFKFGSEYREELENTLKELSARHELIVLTGDNVSVANSLKSFVGEKTSILAEQSPHDKLEYISESIKSGKRTVMVGDGLNDSGALRAATVGIAVTEDISAFAPGCDGIIAAEQLNKLDRFLNMAKRSRGVIIATFVLSILYNTIGLGFAVSGHLSPLVSAILMPISSVSAVLMATLGTRYVAWREGLA